MFERIEPRDTAVDRCAHRLRRAILGGELEPGEKLPAERRLAEQFGVNRVTVRGALAQLATHQLLRVRQGSGYVVRDFREAGGPDLIAALAELASGDELATMAADLLFVRRQLARGVLERLATLPVVDTEPVSRAIAKFAEVVASRAGVGELAQADLAIVAALLDITKSPVLRLCMNPVQRVLMALRPLREAIYAEPEGNVLGWQALLAWLETRDEGAIPVVLEALAERDRHTVSTLAAS